MEVGIILAGFSAIRRQGNFTPLLWSQEDPICRFAWITDLCCLDHKFAPTPQQDRWSFVLCLLALKWPDTPICFRKSCCSTCHASFVWQRQNKRQPAGHFNNVYCPLFAQWLGTLFVAQSGLAAAVLTCALLPLAHTALSEGVLLSYVSYHTLGISPPLINVFRRWR